MQVGETMGEQDELGELYHASYRRLVTQVFAFTTDLTEAQDAVQEAFARALACRRRRTAQATSAAALLLVVTLVLQPWRGPSPSLPGSAATPTAPATLRYTGSGLTVVGITEPGTAPDLPGQVTEVELAGDTGWLRTSCLPSEPACTPSFARTTDGGETWIVAADPAVKVPAPPRGRPDFMVTWLARRPTPAGVWWAAGIAHGGKPTIASSTDDGASWRSTPLPTTGSTTVTGVVATVRGERVIALTLHKDTIEAGYDGSQTGFRRVSGGSGMTMRGEPVLLPDGRLLLADGHSYWQLSTDLGATFQRGDIGLPAISSLVATSGGYAALDLFQAGWVAVSTDGVNWRKLPIR
jgi:hypothetical protein